MPHYDYACSNDKCNHKFEYFQSMSSELLKICPECNSDSLRRLVGKGCGVIFKGSGFYCTDYRKPPEVP